MSRRSKPPRSKNPTATTAARPRKPPSEATIARRTAHAAGLSAAKRHWDEMARTREARPRASLSHQPRRSAGPTRSSPGGSLADLLNCRAHRLALRLAEDVSVVPLPPTAVRLHSELSRAAMSVHLNIAEALGVGPTGRHQLETARGSLWEVRSALMRASVRSFDGRISELDREIARLIAGASSTT